MSESLGKLVFRIGEDLQELENRLKASGEKRTKIRFPRGYLRTASHFRNGYWFIQDDNLRRNIAYTLILSDVYRWLLNRLDLWGTAREMIIKEGICLVGNLCESITKDAAQGICSKNTPFEKRTDAMVKHGMISEELKKSLDALWDWRNREHLFLLEYREYEKYSLKDYNTAILTLRRLREALDRYFCNRKTPN